MGQLIRGCLGLHSVVNQAGKARGYQPDGNSPDATLGFGKIAPNQLDYIKSAYRAREAHELDGTLVGIFIPREITSASSLRNQPSAQRGNAFCIARIKIS